MEMGVLGEVIGTWGLPEFAEKRIKKIGVLQNSPWERFLKSQSPRPPPQGLPPNSSLCDRGWFPSYLPKGLETEAAEGEQQSGQHHPWARKEGKVRMPVVESSLQWAGERDPPHF